MALARGPTVPDTVLVPTRSSCVLWQLHNMADHDRDHQEWLRTRVPRVMNVVLGETLAFVHMWTTVTYSLFGASMLSLRHAYAGSATLWPLQAASDGGFSLQAVKPALRRHLMAMDSSIEHKFASMLVDVRCAVLCCPPPRRRLLGAHDHSDLWRDVLPPQALLGWYTVFVRGEAGALWQSTFEVRCSLVVPRRAGLA